MTKNITCMAAMFSIVCVVSLPGVASAGAPAKSLWSLPERAVYGVLTVPVKVGQRMFPRTTYHFRHYTTAASRTAGKAARDAGNFGGRIIKGSVRTVEKTTQTVGKVVGTIGGTIVRAARPY